MGLFSCLLNPFKSRKKLLDPLNLRRRALDPAGIMRDKNPPRKPTNPLMAKPGNRPGRMPRADFGAKPIGYSPRENIGKPQMMAKPISIAESERLGQEAIAAAAMNQKPRQATLPGTVDAPTYDGSGINPQVAVRPPVGGPPRLRPRMSAEFDETGVNDMYGARRRNPLMYR